MQVSDNESRTINISADNAEKGPLRFLITRVMPALRQLSHMVQTCVSNKMVTYTAWIKTLYNINFKEENDKFFL